jgi:DNA-binding SARP family transcriptional activator
VVARSTRLSYLGSRLGGGAEAASEDSLMAQARKQKAGSGSLSAAASRTRQGKRPRARHPIATDELLDLLPYGIATLDGHGVLTSINRAGRELLGDAVEKFEERDVTCCELFACGGAGVLENRCLTGLALERQAVLPEVRLDVSGGSRAIWVTAKPVEHPGAAVVLQLRPGHPQDRRQRTIPHWAAPRHLEIVSLGRTQIGSAEGSLGGNWLAQRPGQLLKYLVAERGRVVYADEIAEALWPGREQGVLNNVRYFVHALRDKLEPDREPRTPSSFVLSEAGGYRLHRDAVDIDADRFESAVHNGIGAFARGETEAAKGVLEQAMSLYQGDFLSDEPYALWALNERERLRAMAAEALEALTQIAWDEQDFAAAMGYLKRRAQMHPFDSSVERRLIALALRLGQQTFARRHYAAFRMRLLREFGQPPEFELADLVEEGAAGRRQV